MKQVTVIQRVENGALAVALVIVLVAFGLPWWAVLAAFLLFDLSALGYLSGPKVGAIAYNVVHSYIGPALALVGYAVTVLAAAPAPWLAVASACWAFHVAADRALGYGLKLHDFSHTHLGAIGRSSGPRTMASRDDEQ